MPSDARRSERSLMDGETTTNPFPMPPSLETVFFDCSGLSRA